MRHKNTTHFTAETRVVCVFKTVKREYFDHQRTTQSPLNPSVIKSTLFEEDCHDDDACEDRVVLDDESRRASLCVSRARRRKRFLFPPCHLALVWGFISCNCLGFLCLRERVLSPLKKARRKSSIQKARSHHPRRHDGDDDDECRRR